MVSDSSILIQSSIVTTFCNLESDARDEFSTTKRLEGWTEIFGDKESVVDPKFEFKGILVKPFSVKKITELLNNHLKLI